MSEKLDLELDLSDIPELNLDLEELDLDFDFEPLECLELDLPESK